MLGVGYFCGIVDSVYGWGPAETHRRVEWQLLHRTDGMGKSHLSSFSSTASALTAMMGTACPAARTTSLWLPYHS